MASSFETLQSVLAVGHEVVVTGQDARKTRGRVVAIAPGSIDLASPVAAGAWEAALPLYWPLDVGLVLKRPLAASTERTFGEESVVRIDIVDSAKNGAAIGAAVGFSVAAATYIWEQRQPPSSLKGLATTLALVWGLPVSIRMGYVIDRSINAPIYERTQRRARASVVPVFNRESGALMVRLE